MTGPFVTPVKGTVTYDVPSQTAIFTPTGNFASNTTYNVMISTAAKNVAGVPLASPFVWNFSTDVTLDTTAPLVSFTAPAVGDASVAINRKIVATFNEAMDPLTINTANFTVMNGATPVPGTVAYDALNNIAIFTPISLLMPGTTYTALITTGPGTWPGTHWEAVLYRIPGPLLRQLPQVLRS